MYRCSNKVNDDKRAHNNFLFQIPSYMRSLFIPLSSNDLEKHQRSVFIDFLWAFIFSFINDLVSTI